MSIESMGPLIAGPASAVFCLWTSFFRCSERRSTVTFEAWTSWSRRTAATIKP
jgi:hypothetical protein